MASDEVVTFTPLNAVYASVNCSASVSAEIKDHFTFLMPNAQYHPLVKKGHWDGTVSLFKRSQIYIGLRSKLETFCTSRGYQFQYDRREHPVYETDMLDQYIETLKIPPKFDNRDYQEDTFYYGVHHPRSLFLSPTSSGKSLMMYQLTRWHGQKTLIIVPTTALVHQLADDFVDYGFPKDMIHTIAGGERWSDKPVTISTWQSIVAMMDTPEWFEQFGVVFGDEVHRFAAKSLVAIMEAMKHCHIRYGFTGSLDESKTNQLTLEGLFGPIEEVITTKELMDQGYVSQLDIEVVKLLHPEAIRKTKLKYPEEVEYLTGSNARNKFITDLALSLNGNTLILYHRVDGHGKILYEDLKRRTNRAVYFIHGKVDGQERNDVRAQIEEQDDAIIVASVGTFSTGINIKRLHNIIMATSFKSRVMNLQSIGRGLRLGENKDRCTLYDIVDDMSHKKRKNYTLLHGESRIMLYCEQEFNYRMHQVELV